MSNAERQQKWIEKNRALHNFRRRKKNLSGGVESRHADVNQQPAVASLRAESSSATTVHKCETADRGDRIGSEGVDTSESCAPPAQPFPCMISSSFITESVDEPPPTIYRNGRGVVITKREWERQQEIERKAEAGGYEAGDYSQL